MKIITPDLNHDLIFYCTHNRLCVPQVDSQCLEYLGYITLALALLDSNDLTQRSVESNQCRLD